MISPLRWPAQPRPWLERLYQAALEAVHGARLTREARLGLPNAPCHVLAIGKAAAAMAEGALDRPDLDLRSTLVITKDGHLTPRLALDPRVRTLEAGHPLPDARSLAAGRLCLEFLAALPTDDALLVLLSGGASSLIEQPVPGVSLADLIQMNRALLAGGVDILTMNRLRQQLSLIKGGGLGRAVGGRAAEVWVISDVPGDRAETVGSGPFAASLPPLDTAPAVELLAAVTQALGVSPLGTQRAAVPHIPHRVIGRLRDALDAAAAHAEREALPVTRCARRLEGEASLLGRQWAARLREADPGLYIAGGETTVTLPPDPGDGGRCQQFALAAAQALDGERRVTLLAAGSDGGDGPGAAAGAVVDGGTATRGRARGLDPQDHLRRADAGAFLAASGDLLHTGPTGTNVCDLLLALVLPA